MEVSPWTKYSKTLKISDCWGSTSEMSFTNFSHNTFAAIFLFGHVKVEDIVDPMALSARFVLLCRREAVSGQTTTTTLRAKRLLPQRRRR